ncbi:hypothetical protein ACTG9Q_15630 [Actinokineospora sp. 24-640]
MSPRDGLVADLSSAELASAMAETSKRIKGCRANLDIGLVVLHSRWMDTLLDEWSRRRAQPGQRRSS